MHRIIALAAAPLGLAFAVSALAAEPLRVMGFGGSSNWPVFVAQDKGFFERERLEVRLLTAADSATQLASLTEGRIDIAMTAFDNLVAVREGQVQPALAGDADLIAFLGVNHGGRSSLVAQPGTAGVADLKGARLGVDAISTGYAFVLEEMLRRAGLNRGDYELVSVGGGRQRWEALRDKKVAAALLNAPVDATAEAAGFKRLASSADAVERYQGSVGAARRAWARDNEKTLVGFIRAYVAAVDWLYDPANAQEAKAILLKRQERMRPEEAQRSYEELLGPSHGSLLRRAAIDLEGARTVLRLRSSFAMPPKNLDDPNRYYEPRYYNMAVRADG